MESTAQPSLFQQSASWNISVLFTITAEWHTEIKKSLTSINTHERPYTLLMTRVMGMMLSSVQSKGFACQLASRLYANVFICLAAPTPIAFDLL
jgi:hypothetical protein